MPRSGIECLADAFNFGSWILDNFGFWTNVTPDLGQLATAAAPEPKHHTNPVISTLDRAKGGL
jgi:hypothetical protein